jgi:hypothetical protein
MEEAVKRRLLSKLFNFVRRKVTDLRLHKNHVLLKVSEEMIEDSVILLNIINACQLSVYSAFRVTSHSGSFYELVNETTKDLD